MTYHAKLSKEQAEELRLAIKEAKWAIFHLTKLYEMSKPEEAPVIEKNPKQLEMFSDGKEDIQR